jgi:hypothetical protein
VTEALQATNSAGDTVINIIEREHPKHRVIPYCKVLNAENYPVFCQAILSLDNTTRLFPEQKTLLLQRYIALRESHSTPVADMGRTAASLFTTVQTGRGDKVNLANEAIAVLNKAGANHLTTLKFGAYEGTLMVILDLCNITVTEAKAGNAESKNSAPDSDPPTPGNGIAMTHMTGQT